MDCKKITIYTQVYNTEKYLRQCLDSVVNQNYPIHQYIIVDNGSTDGCSEIIKEYAEKYDFIEVVKHETNQRQFSYRLISEKATGDYLVYIDSDDWWEPDYLEKMISFLESNDLDLAVTGTKAYFTETKTSKVMRKLDEPLILTQKEFADNYPQLWTFPSTNWGCIFKTKIYKSINGIEVLNKVSSYGVDTALTLEYIKHCKKIGIDNTALYNYRIHLQSISFSYNTERLKSNIASYELMKDFLINNDVYDSSKQDWLYLFHLSSLTATLDTLVRSELEPKEKFKESQRILCDDLTQAALSKDIQPTKEKFNILVRQLLNKNAMYLIGTKEEHLITELLNEFLVNCKNIFDTQLMPLFIKEPTMWDAFIRDEAEELLSVTLDLIDKNPKYRREYNLPEVVKKLIPEGTPVSDIKDEKFFNLYPHICKLVIDLENTEALEKMTEILFSGKELNCAEDFLNLYVTLAALENHVEAFLFGNIQKAYLFLDENRKDEARKIVNDLVEMGAGESEDVIELQKLL